MQSQVSSVSRLRLSGSVAQHCCAAHCKVSGKSCVSQCGAFKQYILKILQQARRKLNTSIWLLDLALNK